jgi:SAM-dependent methyltransferase
MNSTEKIQPARGRSWAGQKVTTPDTTRAAQGIKVLNYVRGIHASHLIDLGVKLGLFEALTKSPDGMDPGVLAAQLKLYPSYVRWWCETACALELLDYDPAKGYKMAPYMEEFLGRPEGIYYMGALPGTHFILARDYEKYSDLFSNGEVFPYQSHDEMFFNAVAKSTRLLPRLFLEAALPKLPSLAARLNERIRILDVGCGAGCALVEFAERYPNVTSVGVDVEPNSIRMADTMIHSKGLEERVQVRLSEDGSLPEDLVGSFDLVTMFMVLHEIRPEIKDTVLEQCSKALRPDGQFLIVDERYPSSPQELRDAVQIGAVIGQWFEMTWGNEINTREEIHSLLAKQNFKILDEMPLSRFHILLATKNGRAEQ